MNDTEGLFFNLFSAPMGFDVDEKWLDQQYHILANQYHPDRFVGKNTFEQKQAVMMASTINEAYHVLKDPLNRAAYLLMQHGIDADSPEHTQFDPDFLMQQMQWRETLAEATMDQDIQTLIELKQTIQNEQEKLYRTLSEACKQSDWQEAGILVRQGRFLAKLHQEIQVAYAQLSS